MPRLDAPSIILEFTPAMRNLVADAIEALLLLLDEIDGDADREDDPDFEEELDREDDSDNDNESGIGDADGLAEQTGVINGAGCADVE